MESIKKMNLLDNRLSVSEMQSIQGGSTASSYIAGVCCSLTLVCCLSIAAAPFAVPFGYGCAMAALGS